MFESNNIDPFKFDITEVSADMSNADYHSRSEYSSSFLKTVNKHSIGRALVPQPEETPKAFIFGDAFHGMMELGHIDEERFIVKPDGMDFRTKLGKEWKEHHGHKHVMTSDEISSIHGMYMSVMNSPMFKPFLDHPDLEQRDEWSFFADGDDISTKGMKFRVRPDVHFTSKETGSIKYIFDYKSCEDIQKLTRWSFFDFGYDVQAVFYSDVLGMDPHNFIFLAVEKQPPYSCRAIKLTDDSIYSAREKLQKVFKRVFEYQENPESREALDIVLPQMIEL